MKNLDLNSGRHHKKHNHISRVCLPSCLNNYKMKAYLFFLLLINILWTGCDPQELDKVDVGTLPSSDLLSFTVQPGSNAFKFVVKNTSSVAGIPKWTFGNGRTGTEPIDTAYYPEPGTYTITMTLYTKAGAVVKTQEITTTETDWPFFNDPDNVMLSGGTDALNGKSWVLDSMTTGHLGVGPGTGDAIDSTGLIWWAAPPLDKKGLNLYDDKINFATVGFVCTYTNHGKSFVKSFRGSDPNYTNVVDAGGEKIVEFTPKPGKWAIQKTGGRKYLILSSDKPIFPCFDVGAINNKYHILSLQSNRLELVAQGGDNNNWHYFLIPEGYVKPMLAYTLSVVATANPNEYTASLTNVTIPSGMSITNIVWKLGDGTEVTETDINKPVVHTYMRKGTYSISVNVTTSGEPVGKNTTLIVPQNHPSYVPYLLDAMVMYQDFGESSYVTMGFDKSDGDGSIVTVSNPDPSKYPNISANVGKYTKIKAQYANAYLKLNPGYQFNLTKQTVFKLLVYGKAGDVVLLKLENTSRGGNAWQTGAESNYTIKKDNTWEIATYDFKGVAAGNNSTGDIYTSDVTTDTRFNSDFYDIIRIMYRPGDNSTTFTFYFDDLAGPHTEGI
jgi:hypothetical protein